MPVKVELPSGAWVEIRDKLGAKDKWAIGAGYNVRVENGVSILPGNLGGLQMKAFLASVITGWGGPGLDGVLIPAQSPEGADILDRALSDLDDYDVLEDAVTPLFQRVQGGGRPNPEKAAATPSSS